MSDFERFEKLAARARGESPPALDVRDKVLQRLAWEERAVLATHRTLAVCSAVSAVAALVMVAVTVWTWIPWTDPLGHLIAQNLTGVP